MLNGLLALWIVVQSSHSEEAEAFKPAAIVTQNVPRIPAAVTERLRQYQNARSAAFRGWRPDGNGMLIATRFADTAQLHHVAFPLARREQLTFFDEPVTGTYVPKSPEGALLLSMSQGGSEDHQIYFDPRKNGKVLPRTDGKSRNVLQAVSYDGKLMVIGSNQRNGRDTDLYLADPRTGSPTMLLQVDRQHWQAEDWSHDGKRIALNRFVSVNESYPAIWDAESKRQTPLKLDLPSPASFDSLRFSADDKSLYFATDARGEFRELNRLDLATGAITRLSAAIPWDIDSIVVDPTSGRVAFTANEDGASALYLLERDQPARLETPAGVISSLEFSPDGGSLGFTLALPNAPADAYSLDLAQRGLTRWTISETGGLDPATFVAPSRIQFDSFDGRKVPAYLFRPMKADPGKRLPVLIWIHGGPESQYQPYFSGLQQYLVTELGLALIAPNVRGSAGYGKTYLKLDNAEKREDSVRDIGALLDWVGQQPDLDPKRVGVIGGSYGGYMVLASLTTFGDRIRAGIDIVGIASFSSFLKTTSAYRVDLRRAEYGDERDPKMQEVFRRIDPLHNAGKIRAALMVVHGKNDPRVPFSEAEQIAAKVRSQGQAVWTVYADNEGHGFAKKPNRDYLDAATVLFLERRLIAP